MALNKTLCLHCVKNHHYATPLPQTNDAKNMSIINMVCTIPLFWKIIRFPSLPIPPFNPKITNPPDDCPYLLEHIINRKK